MPATLLLVLPMMILAGAGWIAVSAGAEAPGKAGAGLAAAITVVAGCDLSGGVWGAAAGCAVALTGCAASWLASGVVPLDLGDKGAHAARAESESKISRLRSNCSTLKFKTDTIVVEGGGCVKA